MDLRTRRQGTFAATDRVHARDPADLNALLTFLGVSVLGALGALWAENTIAGIEGDVAQLFSHLPTAVVGFGLLAVQAVSLLLFLGLPLILLVMRRWRLWGTYTLGYLAASLVTSAAQAALPTEGLPALPFVNPELDGFGDWPTSSFVASAVAGLVVLSPQLPRQWRRFGWGYVAALSLARMVTADAVTIDLLLAVGLGGVSGNAVLLAFGRRVDLPSATAVQAALDRVGLFPITVTANADSGSATLGFAAVLADGQRLHCKVIAAGQHEADNLFRTYRRVRVRELGEEFAYSSVRRAAAVESMLAMTAHRNGARTPAVAALVPLGTDEMLIAFQEVRGTLAASLTDEEFTDDLLDQLWTAVAALRRGGIAHRDLQLTSWLIDDDGLAWLIDFSFGEPAASAGALAGDISELLAATHARVGATRAVAAAVRVLGPQELASGLGHLVPVALTRNTRTALKKVDGGLQPLIAEAARACGVPEPQFAPIERVKPRTLVMAGLMAVAIYVLLPQLADLPRMAEAIREADPKMVGLAGLASVLTYVGSGMAIAGSIPQPVRLWHSLAAAVSAAFVGAVAPPGIGHVGLNVRFVQKQGLAPEAAISSTAAKEVGVGTVHMLLLAILALLAGSSGALTEELKKLPSLQTVAIGASIVLALIGLAAATPKARSFVLTSVVPAVRNSVASLQELASRPEKILLLFTGGLLLQLSYVSALYFSVRALGGVAGFATVGLIYLTVGSAAAIAPTPGGIGAVEAVLLTALTGIGMAAAPALAAVFLYRLVTFWVPIPAGAAAFRLLMSRDLL